MSDWSSDVCSSDLPAGGAMSPVPASVAGTTVSSACSVPWSTTTCSTTGCTMYGRPGAGVAGATGVTGLTTGTGTGGFGGMIMSPYRTTTITRAAGAPHSGKPAGTKTTTRTATGG